MARSEGDNNVKYTFGERQGYGASEVFYEVQKDEALDLVICRRPDDFFVAWPTNVTNGRFLQTSSDLIDRLDSLPMPSRKYEEDNPARVTVVVSEETVIHVPPSYTGFGFDNLAIGTAKDTFRLDFTKTDWPLSIDGLRKTINKKSKKDRGSFKDDDLTDTSRIWARINGPQASLFYNNTEYPHIFSDTQELSFWSDRLPKDELVDLYQTTATDPMPIDIFIKRVDSTVGDREVKRDK